MTPSVPAISSKKLNTATKPESMNAFNRTFNRAWMMVCLQLYIKQDGTNAFMKECSCQSAWGWREGRVAVNLSEDGRSGHQLLGSNLEAAK